MRWIFTWRCTIGCSWLPFSIFLLMLCQQIRKGTQQGYLRHWLMHCLLGHFIYRGVQMQAVYIYISIKIIRNLKSLHICCHIDIGEKDGQLLLLTDIGGLLYWSLIYRAITWCNQYVVIAVNWKYLNKDNARIWYTHSFYWGMITSKAVDHPLLICYCFMNCMWGPM